MWSDQKSITQQIENQALGSWLKLGGCVEVDELPVWGRVNQRGVKCKEVKDLDSYWPIFVWVWHYWSNDDEWRSAHFWSIQLRVSHQALSSLRVW